MPASNENHHNDEVHDMQQNQNRNRKKRKKMSQQQEEQPKNTILGKNTVSSKDDSGYSCPW
jgi:hypothetical protein